MPHKSMIYNEIRSDMTPQVHFSNNFIEYLKRLANLFDG